VAADTRELRDQLEKLQARARLLRAQLDDPKRLDVVRAEVSEELARLRYANAAAVAELARVRPLVEDARVASMSVKRERSEQSAAFGAAARATAAIGALTAVGAAGLHYGETVHWPLLGAGACVVGAATFVAVVWKLGRG
jgi:hypothetical protein